MLHLTFYLTTRTNLLHTGLFFLHCLPFSRPWTQGMFTLQTSCVKTLAECTQQVTGVFLVACTRTASKNLNIEKNDLYIPRDGMAQLVGHCSANQKVASSIPSPNTCLGCRFGPQSLHVWKAANWCFSLT